MILGKVTGTVVSTQKEPGLEGHKLLVVQPVALDLQPSDKYFVAVDAIGAGPGEMVLCVSGSAARIPKQTFQEPVDIAVVAIVDYLDIEGKTAYRKEADL